VRNALPSRRQRLTERFAVCDQSFYTCSAAHNAKNRVKKPDVLDYFDPIDDPFPEETGWTFKQTIGGHRLLLAHVTSTLVNERIGDRNAIGKCARQGRCRFMILDTEGDGICCSCGRGLCEIYINGVLKYAATGRFRFQQTVRFNLY
jgi:hypothetical protein